jgi:hypothetical protein
MSKWVDGRLDLGALGRIHLFDGEDRTGRTEFWFEAEVNHQSRAYRTEDAASRSAIAWLRRALKQASKRLEG